MNKYIILLFAINLLSCNSSSEDIIKKDCNCIRQEKRVITYKYDLVNPTVEELGESWKVCKNESTDWVYYGSNLPQDYPQKTFYYKITCNE